MHTLAVDLSRLPLHLLLMLGLTWIAGAFLRGVLMNQAAPITPLAEGADETEDENIPPTQPKRWAALGAVETSVILGLVNVLFAAFVLTQLRYLFGGLGVIVETHGLTMAEYARRGFFELIGVATLAVPFLLTLYKLPQPETAGHERLFRFLAGVQIALLCVMLMSAGQRMWLYQQSYGLTALRLYTSAFMVWLGLTLVWFMFSVLRGYVERFAQGTLAASLAIVSSLHLVNPEALIVRTNVARAAEGKPFDAHYLTTLSADATPALIDALPQLNRSDQYTITSALLDRWAEPTNWRTWNHARTRARQAIQANADQLEPLFGHRPPE